MIYKTVAVAVGLLIVYLLAVPKLKPWYTAQNQWQTNLVSGQDFIYTHKNSKAIIVGSSLAKRLAMDSLPGIYNLSFSGLGIFDGLRLLSIHPTESLPEYIFIEMNALQRTENTSFTQALLNPVNYYPRRWFSELREDKQPIGIAGNYLNRKLTRNVLTAIKPSGYSTSTDANLFKKLLQDQQNTYAIAPSQEVVQTNLAQLKEYITYFQSKNMKVVFFEMPVDTSLYSLPKATSIRQAFYSHFPATTYSYIPYPRKATYATTDGLHLTQSEAMEYTLYFRKEISPYLSIK